MKKGFTLIELLTVIAVITAIGVVIASAVNPDHPEKYTVSPERCIALSQRLSTTEIPAACLKYITSSQH